MNSTSSFKGAIKQKHRGFKLISLELSNFPFFGDITYKFVDSHDKQDKIYTTVLIGPNGTRKSFLFNLIIYIFKCVVDILSQKQIDYKRFGGGIFHLVYSLDNRVYEIARIYSKNENGSEKYHYAFKVDGKKAIVSEILLPQTIIGNSVNITDKFPVFKENEFPQFQYLGIKYNAQSASTKSFIKKTIDYVSKMCYSEPFLQSLGQLLNDFVAEGKTIRISYKTTNHKKFFNGDLNTKVLDDFFTDIEMRYREKQKIPPFKLNAYNSLKKSDSMLHELIKYCNTLAVKDEFQRMNGASNRIIKFNLTQRDDLEKLKLNGAILNNLYSIGLLVDPKIEIIGGTEGEYSLEDSSSGEHNILTSLIGIIATMKPNSLLMIDEPEISLHPNWQMKYVSFLKRVLSSENYSTSHILIATHSHFIISDLEGNSSKIIGLSKENNLSIIPLDPHLDTFSWSAEEVLLKIFQVASSRNYFIAENLGLMLDFISDPKSDDESIKEKYFDLQLDKISGLTDNDPLKTVLNKIKLEYVSKGLK